MKNNELVSKYNNIIIVRTTTNYQTERCCKMRKIVQFGEVALFASKDKRNAFYENFQLE